jgi:hypothetical protein
VNSQLDEREQRLVANCCAYAEGDPAGLPGHDLMIIIAKLIAQADELLHLAGKGADHLQIDEMIAEYSRLVNGHNAFFGDPPAGQHVLRVALHKLKLMVAAYDVNLDFFLANASTGGAGNVYPKFGGRAQRAGARAECNSCMPRYTAVAASLTQLSGLRGKHHHAEVDR